MWKNSDTDNPRHSLLYADHRGYPFLGIIRNSSKNEATAGVWAGTNAEGFSIMNTMSYNLTDSAVTSRNGSLMRQALERCRTVDDFQHMLDTLPRPLKVETNYGVIDAQGNAAYFETFNNGYRKLDVNDPAVAPSGYLIYTNFSYTGFYDRGQGYIRYQTAMYETAKVAPNRGFTPQWILNKLARSYYHSLLGVDFASPEAMQLFAGGYIPDQDLIPRHSTASATVIQGVRPGENPELTTLWAALGYPPCAIAIPAWVKLARNNSPLVMRNADTRSSRLSDQAEAYKQTLYDVKRGHGDAYLHFSQVYNAEGTGYRQLLQPIEEHLFNLTNHRLNKWRTDGKLSVKEAQLLISETEHYVEEHLPPVRF
jgi:hypothetical protein